MENVREDKKSLSARVAEWIKSDKEMPYSLEYDLCEAKRRDLTWDMFYDIYESKYDKEHKWWYASKAATALLAPIIAAQFYKNQNGRISEVLEEDFTSEVLIMVQQAMPNYDRSKSQFPKFIGLYIKQVGYVHNKDASIYEQKKTGFRVFSQNAITSGDSGNTAVDPFYNTASEFNMDEEVIKRDEQERDSIFKKIVVEKYYSKGEEKNIRIKAQGIDKGKKYAEKIIAKYPGKEKQECIRKNYHEMFNSAESDGIIERDNTNTKINTAIWSKFLGGVPSYEGFFMDKINETLSGTEPVNEDEDMNIFELE